MTDTIIKALRNYMKDFSGLRHGAPLWVDYLGSKEPQYRIVPMAGERTVETFITGKSVREYPFMFQSMQSTADDAGRLENNGFYETLADWFDSQTDAGDLPELGGKKSAISIEAVTSGFLMEQGESNTGVYSIQCKLTYEQGS